MTTMTTILALTMPLATLTGPETFLLVRPEIVLVAGAIVAYLAGAFAGVRRGWLIAVTAIAAASPAASPVCMKTGSSRTVPQATCVAPRQTGTSRFSHSCFLGVMAR